MYFFVDQILGLTIVNVDLPLHFMVKVRTVCFWECKLPSYLECHYS